MERLPIEIEYKIYFYAHPMLDKKLQKEIKNHSFRTKKFIVREKYCVVCSRNHRIPQHFYCF